jgi:hypothetical protein
VWPGCTQTYRRMRVRRRGLRDGVPESQLGHNRLSSRALAYPSYAPSPRSPQTARARAVEAVRLRDAVKPVPSKERAMEGKPMPEGAVMEGKPTPKAGVTESKSVAAECEGIGPHETAGSCARTDQRRRRHRSRHRHQSRRKWPRRSASRLPWQSPRRPIRLLSCALRCSLLLRRRTPAFMLQTWQFALSCRGAAQSPRGCSD